ncbi:cytochrome c1 [Coemansia sp. RSA 518]|nr:cytochrome c1 [Coemansia sp. RSA 518]KAJ2282271.1 cytochrome c1 [Coemansia sp. RSA 370]
MAEECKYTDNPDDQGEMFECMGKLTDLIPHPYTNEEVAQAANSRALPSDLSLITNVQHGGVNYIHALLTGCTNAPAGVDIKEGLNYNLYFPRGSITKVQNIFDGIIKYEDKIPNTMLQIIKDVVAFLNWATEPEFDDCKKIGAKVALLFLLLIFIALWIKCNRWHIIKSFMYLDALEIFSKGNIAQVKQITPKWMVSNKNTGSNDPLISSCTPLHLAIQCPRKDIIVAILDLKLPMPIDTPDAQGMTAVTTEL